MNRHKVVNLAVGQPLEGVEVKIGENNEILCLGHNVMLSYYRPELTAQVIDKDGWLHTGDTGKMSPDGALTIAGQLKNIFKSSFRNILIRKQLV